METFDVENVINSLKTLSRPAAKTFLEAKDADLIRIAISNYYKMPVCVSWLLDAMFSDEKEYDLSCEAHFNVSVKKLKYDYVDIVITGTIDGRAGSIREVNAIRSDILQEHKDSKIKMMLTDEYQDWIDDAIDKQQEKED